MLGPGGRFVCRVILPPERAETEAELRDAALSGRIHNFHAFKLRLGMALAARQPQPQIDVETLMNAFNAMFPDRDELVRVTGWNRGQVDTIDYYRGSKVVHAFPAGSTAVAALAGLCADRIRADERIRTLRTLRVADRRQGLATAHGHAGRAVSHGNR